MNFISLGAQIKVARERKNLTQEELAETLGLQPFHIAMLENGEKPPKVETLVNLANALEVSADDLLRDSLSYPNEEPFPEFSELLGKLSPEDRWRVYSSLRAFVECTPSLL